MNKYLYNKRLKLRPVKPITEDWIVIGFWVLLQWLHRQHLDISITADVESRTQIICCPSSVWHSAWKREGQRTCPAGSECRPALYTCIYDMYICTACECRVELQEACRLAAALDDMEPTDSGIMRTAPCRAAWKSTTDGVARRSNCRLLIRRVYAATVFASFIRSYGLQVNNSDSFCVTNSNAGPLL